MGNIYIKYYIYENLGVAIKPQSIRKSLINLTRSSSPSTPFKYKSTISKHQKTNDK